MNILVINQCATNKGDRAVLFFVLRELTVHGAEQITVSTSNPKYWDDKNCLPKGVNVRFIPYGWDTSCSRKAGIIRRVLHRVKTTLERQTKFSIVRNALRNGKRPWYLPIVINREYRKAIEKADIVISSGGHHLTTINARDAVYPQTFDMAVALLYGKPLILWSQSVGTFDFKHPKNRMMMKQILSGADQIIVRNKSSIEEILEIGVSCKHVTETCESVFGLYDIVQTRIKPSERPNIMGVSVYASNIKTADEYVSYTSKLSELVGHSICAGYKVRFFPMELTGADRPCIESIIEKVENKKNCEIVEGFPDTVEHINAISQCKMFVGHKTHSVIFSLVAATPLIAIAYHKKTEDFMAQFGIGKHCIPDTRLSGAKLIKMFDEVKDNLDAISRKEETLAYEIYKQVKSDFAKMLSRVHTD